MNCTPKVRHNLWGAVLLALVCNPRSNKETSKLKKSFKKNENGSYHMDYKFDKDGVLHGHGDLPNGHPHKTTPHINYMTPEGKKGTIFIVK